MTKLKDAGAFANTGEQSTGNSNLMERK